MLTVEEAEKETGISHQQVSRWAKGPKDPGDGDTRRHAATTPKECPTMPEKPTKLPAIGWAGFENSPAAAGHGRRKPRWSLRPTVELGEGATADAGRFVKGAEVLRGLGRKPTE
jgi:hypothetical protein